MNSFLNERINSPASLHLANSLSFTAGNDLTIADHSPKNIDPPSATATFEQLTHKNAASRNLLLFSRQDISRPTPRNPYFFKSFKNLRMDEDNLRPFSTFLTGNRLDSPSSPTQHEPNSSTMLLTRNMTSPDAEKSQSLQNLLKTLEYNRNQHNMFMTEMNSEAKKSYMSIFNRVKDRRVRESRMPKISHKVNKGVTFINTDSGNTGLANFMAEHEDIFVNHKPLQRGETKLDATKDTTKHSSKMMEESIPATIFVGLSLKINPLLYRPEGREGGTFIRIGKKGYLWGGISRKIHNDVEIYDFHKYTWIRSEGTEGLIAPVGLYGHCSVAWNNNIYMFGGEFALREHFLAAGTRRCSDEMVIFDTKNLTWKVLPSTGNEQLPRRNHVGFVVGENFFIHGGIGTKGKYYNDLWRLNLQSMRWSHEPIDPHSSARYLSGIAYHACAVAFNYRTDVSNIYNIRKEDNIVIDQEPDKVISKEGVYFFGGMTEKSDALSKLSRLVFGVKPLRMEVIETTGIKPKPKFQHSLNFLDKLGYLVLAGGRNDKLETPCLNEMHVLNMETLVWQEVRLAGFGFDARSGHTSVTYRSQLFIFGGANLSSFSSADIRIFEFEQDIAKKQFKKGNKKRTDLQTENSMKRMMQFQPTQINTEHPTGGGHEKVQFPALQPNTPQHRSISVGRPNKANLAPKHVSRRPTMKLPSNDSD